MVNHKFAGTGVAITTPFNVQNEPDLNSLTNHVNYLKSNNVDFLVVLGTTGESVTLNRDEQEKVVNTIVKANNGELPVVLGMGGNNTKALLEKINSTDFKGIDGILSVAPYYNKPTQKGLYEHFKLVAENSPVPVILYNVPGRTGKNIDPATILQLANDFKNIVAVKEASGSIEQSMEIIRNIPQDFIVLSGEDAITLPLMSVGISGVISVVGNVLPKETSAMVRAANNNDFKKARDLHYKLLPVIEKLFAEGNPAGIKCALELKKIIPGYLRLPLTKVSDKLRNEIQKDLNQFK
jgi:4-hydroxy-tetrahydrodipicolinate synthase